MPNTIVILSAFLSPFRSGAEAMVEEVSSRLSQQYDITILTGRYSRNLPREDTLPRSRVRIIRIGIGHPLDKYLFPLLAPLTVRTLKPAIVHAVLESYAGLALAFTRLCYPRAKRILTLQSTNTTLLLGIIHAAAEYLTAISTPLISRAMQYGRKDVILIRNGVDTAHISAAVSAHARIEDRVLFVGRLEPMKGVDTLLSAFSLMKASNSSLKTCHLRIVGSGSCRAALEEHAKKLGIASHVTFAGPMAPLAVYEEYAKAAVFCGLSRSEALGNVFLEAQAAGCAVLATTVGGIPTIVSDGTTGLLVAPDDPQAAADALTRLLTDSALRRSLTEHAKAHVAAYDWSTITQQYRDLYDQIIFTSPHS